MATVYFTPATFRFLRELAANNNRPWFQCNKSRYIDVLREPLLQLIADMADPLQRISPHYRAEPRSQGGSMLRIYRDARRIYNRGPYKTWGGARFGHERRREVHAPAFYLHIEPDLNVVGAGIWGPEQATLNRIRAFLADNPESWKKATRSRAFRQRFEFRGESLSRPPRGYDGAHELIEDLKRKHFAASRHFEDTIVCSSELLPFSVDCFRRLAAMMDYLCAALDLEF